MKMAFLLAMIVTIAIAIPGSALAQNSRPGTEEFGMSPKELVQAVEKVEALIADCMHKQGFEYVPNDYKTVHRGMISDKSLPGMDEEEFVEQYGFGVSTLYTGQPPQLNQGYSPGRIGLGERNVEIFKKLSPSDQAAYNRALLGNNVGATFAVSLHLLLATSATVASNSISARSFPTRTISLSTLFAPCARLDDQFHSRDRGSRRSRQKRTR